MAKSKKSKKAKSQPKPKPAQQASAPVVEPVDAAPTETEAAPPATTPELPWWQRLQGIEGIQYLELASLAYISLPVFIFFLGWLKFPIAAVLSTAFFVFMVHGSTRAINWAKEQEGPGGPSIAYTDPVRLGIRAGLMVALIAFCVACTGAGGMTFQFSDYWVYDGHLREMIEYPWPMGVILKNVDPPLEMPGAVYWGYWLPSGMVGRAFGWYPAYVFQLVWNIAGVLLATLWFLRIVGRASVGFVLMFLFFGGIDVIGYVVTTPLPDGVNVSWYDYFTGTFAWSTGRGWMSHWSANFSLLTAEGRDIMGGVFYRFYGLLSFLCDGPHHVLPEIVLILLVLHDALRRKTVERLFFLTSTLPLFSIFATIGTVPVLALSAIHTRLRGLLTPGNLVVGPLIVLMFLSYYSSVETKIPTGPLWAFQDVSKTWSYLLLYYFSAFLVYVIVAPSMKANGYRPGRMWFYTAVAIFLLAPWFRMGVFNDFTTKVIVPSQMVFVICLATAIAQPAGPMAHARRYALIAALVLGAWSGLGVLHRALDFGFTFKLPPMNRASFTVDHMLTTRDSNQIFKDDTIFWNYLAKPVQYTEAPLNEPTEVYEFGTRHNPEYWIYFTPKRRTTGDKLIVPTQGDEPFLRRDNMEVHTRLIGSIELDHRVYDEDGNVPDYSIIFQWANEEHLNPDDPEDWPFHRWRSNVVWPPQEPVNPISANPYWRGTVKSIALYLDIHGDPSKTYTVEVEELRFMQR